MRNIQELITAYVRSFRMSARAELQGILEKHHVTILRQNKAVELIGCINILINYNQAVIDLLLAAGFRNTTNDPVGLRRRILEKGNVVVQMLSQ
jgi:hypothetical protein